LPERGAPPALEAGELGAVVTAAQMRMEPVAVSPGQAPVEIARDGGLRMEAMRRRPHCLSDAESRRFLLAQPVT
jgi:hypothetical protein